MGIFSKFKKNNKKEQTKEEQKYDKTLSKTKDNFVSKLISLTDRYSKINEDFFYELEEILIMADVGVNTVMKFIDKLKERVSKEKITDPVELKEIIVDELFIIYVNGDIISSKINYNDNGPTIILFVGVNGVGKTTSIAKLAFKEMQSNKKVLLVGADTFRAGAVKQLKEWADRLECDFVGDENIKDPAAVVHIGLTKAKNENYDIVLIDTAGRLQNKVNLMKELEKINKVAGSIIENAPHETLLVLDATTGQNGIIQAKEFKNVTNVTGTILTKLDGTAKGGIVLAIKDEVGLPVKYIGTGETMEDLSLFDIEKYIYSLFKDMIK